MRVQATPPDQLKMNSFSVEAMIRGYHVYRDIWDASIGEVLRCQREASNPTDRYAVAIEEIFGQL